MSDDEEYSDEEEVKEPERKPAAHDSHHEAQGTDILKNRQDQKRAELDEVLKEYIAEWRKQRVKEEEELKKLKEKQARRKVFRAEEDKRLAMMKKKKKRKRKKRKKKK